MRCRQKARLQDARRWKVTWPTAKPGNPFLAPAIVKFAAPLPEELHLTSQSRERNLLNEAFVPLLPPRIVDKPKQPYRAPDAASFLKHNGALLPWVQEALAPARLADT